MKVCILGNGLISLTLAQTLVKQGIYVDIFSIKNPINYKKTQTLGISRSNVNFFNKNILNIQNLLWDINKIEIYSENLNNEQILNFENQNEKLFSIVKNYQLYNLLLQELKKNYLCSFKKTINLKNLLGRNYKLVINTDYSNPLTKKLFHRQFRKDYKSFAYTSIIKHKKLKNNIATQIFTSKGPLAFLPLSKTETSIVYSFKGNEKIDFKQCVKKYNNRYEILSFRDISSFKLISSDLRSYFNKNVLAFGDLLHKIHPLAGQGFNMSLRDTREILNLIKSKKENGLDLDYSICIDFEKKTRHKNLIFSNSVDFIYEYFNFENKVKKNFLSKAVKYLGKNNKINKILTNVADNGFMI